VRMMGHARAGMGYRNKFQTENEKTLQLTLYYGVFEELLRPHQASMQALLRRYKALVRLYYGVFEELLRPY
jgi:hypothetical protein